MNSLVSKTVDLEDKTSEQLPDTLHVGSRLANARAQLSTLIPYARYGVQKVGPLGAVGIAAAFFSLVTFMSGNLPLRQQLSDQQSQLAAARENAEQLRSGNLPQSPDQQAAGFVQALPSSSEVPVIMSSIVAVAAASGIELQSGTYEYLAADDDSIARYKMALPVKGTYPEVRKFIEDVLAVQPAVALDSMRIERGKVADQAISADLRFSLLLESNE